MKLTRTVLTAIAFLVLQLHTAAGYANALPQSTPECDDDHGNSLSVDNEDVLLWKTTTANQTLKRAHISGKVVALYPDHNGHTHFSAQIGPNRTDTIEVIYNISFGMIKSLTPGMTVEACGDYITSIAPAGIYQASPDKAIIHWIHKTDNPNKHRGGFLIINGTLYGFGHGNGN